MQAELGGNVEGGGGGGGGGEMGGRIVNILVTAP